MTWNAQESGCLNVAKTEFMLIGYKPMIKSISNEQPNTLMENISIKQVYESKTLGVTAGQHLTWKNNTDNICKKITSGISALRRVKEFVQKDTLITIYNSIFIHTLPTAVRYGMFLEKHNLNPFKNSKTERLG